jgi:hypothetical protein
MNQQDFDKLIQWQSEPSKILGGQQTNNATGEMKGSIPDFRISVTFCGYRSQLRNKEFIAKTLWLLYNTGD